MTLTTKTTGSQTGSLINPQVLMAIRNLELRARVVVEGFWSGLHRSPYHGFSVEFTEYRAYTPGDDPRYLDWRLFARSDRYYIKRFEEETNLRCHLLVDHSRSMNYGTLGYTKAQYANTLAATLAYFLDLQGDAVGLLSFDERVRDYLPARHRPGHLRHLMLALEKPVAGTATDLTAPLKQMAEVMKKRGLVILLSDLLAPIETLEKDLAGLSAGRHEIVVFLLLDPAETRFDFSQAGIYQDVESGRDLYLDPVVARKGYLHRLETHLAAVKNICQGLGIEFHRWSTDRPMELALFDFLRSRTRANKKLRRARAEARSGRP